MAEGEAFNRGNIPVGQPAAAQKPAGRHADPAEVDIIRLADTAAELATLAMQALLRAEPSEETKLIRGRVTTASETVRKLRRTLTRRG